MGRWPLPQECYAAPQKQPPPCPDAGSWCQCSPAPGEPPPKPRGAVGYHPRRCGSHWVQGLCGVQCPRFASPSHLTHPKTGLGVHLGVLSTMADPIKCPLWGSSLVWGLKRRKNHSEIVSFTKFLNATKLFLCCIRAKKNRDGFHPLAGLGPSRPTVRASLARAACRQSSRHGPATAPAGVIHFMCV